MKKFSFIFLLFCVSCMHQEKKEWKKITDFDQVGLKIMYNKEVTVNTEACVSIFFEKKDFIIKQAYGGCNPKKELSINKQENKINECNQKLFIINDTIKLCLKPIEEGSFVFPNISILFTDEENNYFIADTTLTCEVKP